MALTLQLLSVALTWYLEDASVELEKGWVDGPCLTDRLSEHLPHFTQMIVDKTARPTAEDLPQMGEIGGPDHVEFHELAKAPRQGLTRVPFSAQLERF